jgi:hypothetical protein
VPPDDCSSAKKSYAEDCASRAARTVTATPPSPEWTSPDIRHPFLPEFVLIEDTTPYNGSMKTLKLRVMKSLGSIE